MPQVVYVKEGTEMPEREAEDFYPTPYPFALYGLDQIPNWFFEQPPEKYTDGHFWWQLDVLDPGTGTGVWGNALRDKISGRLDRNKIHVDIVGIDTRDIPCPEGYKELVHGDFLVTEFKQKFNLIIGNPPYNKATDFVKKSFSLLKPGGFLVFLLRLEYLGSLERTQLFDEMPPFEVVVCGNRPSFTANKKTGLENYAYYLWHTPYPSRERGFTLLNWVEVPRGFTKEEMEAWIKRKSKS